MATGRRHPSRASARSSSAAGDGDAFGAPRPLAAEPRCRQHGLRPRSKLELLLDERPPQTLRARRGDAGAASFSGPRRPRRRADGAEASPAAPRRARFPSIAPVGLDLAAGRDSVYEDDEIHVTAGLVIPPRRRNLGKLVIGTVAACALILVAAGVARVSQASNESSGSAPASSPSPARPTPATATTAGPQAPQPVTPPVPGTVGVRAPDSSSTGTVRLDKPAAAGRSGSTARRSRRRQCS